MHRNSVSEIICVGSVSRTPHKLGIDVKCMHMTCWADALGKFNGGVTGATAKIANHMTFAYFSWGVEWLTSPNYSRRSVTKMVSLD